MKTISLAAAFISIVTLMSFSSQSCNEKAKAVESKSVTASHTLTNAPFLLSDEFKNYWYAGKAELNSYKLQQARYGEIHDGTAVLVFVTEDFSGSKQVKLDHPENAGEDKLPVMKLNFTKKFVTGIYPYSMMLSSFSPVDISNYPHAIKTTASVQEWCGMTYTQLNQRNNKNEIISRSYFEDEGDKSLSFDVSLTEDELWNLIRIAPDRLPTGDQKVLPGSLFTRLSHVPLQIQDAKLRLDKREEKNLYFIEYPALKYLLVITFTNKFPYKIIGWEETFPGFDGKSLTTTATLDKTIMLDYWNHNHKEDRSLRTQLDLPENL